MKPMIVRWTVNASRYLTKEEKNAVEKAEVVISDYGHSVCFFMKANKPNVYIPLSNDSIAEAGDAVNLDELEVLTLERKDFDDPDIIRVRV